MTELKRVRVTDLYVSCSYPVRANALASSGNCGKYAQTAVRCPDGILYYRCAGHRGMINADTIGHVHETVLTDRNIAERLVVS